MIQNGSEQIFVQYLPNERQLAFCLDWWVDKTLKIKLLSFASPKQTTQQKVRPKVIITVKI